MSTVSLEAPATDRELLQLVRPPDWQNPRPQWRYNLVVIGAGTAGLVAAAGAASLGARVALVERHRLGGDCLNFGCVPSKSLIAAAREFHASPSRRDGAAAFEQAMARMRAQRAGLAIHDSAQRFASLGVDVFFGEARFVGRREIEVDGRCLRFSRAVIATGSRAAALPVPGLDGAGYLTNETVFSLERLPRRLAVIGAGPIGCELAQVFARFGSEVSIVSLDDRVLPREDADASAVLSRHLEADGVRLLLGSHLSKVERRAEAKVVWFDRGAGPEALECDEILVAVGRRPGLQNLGLEVADVSYDGSGVKVNSRLQTTNPRVFAAGDVCSKYKFTHAADAMARIVLRNALFYGRSRADALVIPWSTYTDPEIAHVGVEPASPNVAKTYSVPFAGVDRAVLEGRSDGFVRIHVDSAGKLLGGTIVGARAGDLIGYLAQAIADGKSAATLASQIHPYPTFAEAIRKAGDAHMRDRLTPRVRSLFRLWFEWTR